MNPSTSKPPSPVKQKRKRKSQLRLSTSEHKNMKLNPPETAPITTMKPPKSTVKRKAENPEIKKEIDFSHKYPILKDQNLVCKFLKVQMTNNQKGRIRQAVRESLQGTSSILEPEVIHSKIQSILRNSPNLTDSELRRIRILYNLLKTALKEKKLSSDGIKPKKADKTKKKMEGDNLKSKDTDKKEKKTNKTDANKTDANKTDANKTDANKTDSNKTDANKTDANKTDSNKTDANKTDTNKTDSNKTVKEERKPRGPKRYIVFLGNLPLDVDKDKIIKHFSEMNEQIVDIRIPKLDGKKNAIAYLELKNEPSYEFALSKHHSMLGNKRINVLYTAPKKGKITKEKAKSKSAKLIALQKSGKLVGSVPLAKKRSQRRLKKKQAQAKLAAQTA